MGIYESLPEETRFKLVQAASFMVEKAIIYGEEYCIKHKAEIIRDFKKWFSEMPEEEKKELFELWKKSTEV